MTRNESHRTEMCNKKTIFTKIMGRSLQIFGSKLTQKLEVSKPCR